MQYVGARYVPKFMGLYNATQAYEALCVVDNGMGTSYITKVPTPAGTPLTDTDYYAVYGASSGAIINLQNQIGDLNDLNTTDKDSLVDAINEVDGDIQTLTNKLCYIDVVGEGVDNTGSSDVTADIQTIMDNHPNTILFFKSGEYRFDGELTMKASFEGEMGYDALGATLHYTGSNDFMTFTGGNGCNLHLNDISIELDTTSATNNGIVIDNTSGVRLHNLSLEKCNIKMHLARVCYLDNIWSNHSYRGIYMGSCVRIYLSNFEFSNTTTCGIEMAKDDNSQICDVIGIMNGETNQNGTYGVYCHDMVDGFARFYFVQTSQTTSGGWKIENCDQMSLINCYAELGYAGFGPVNYGLSIITSTQINVYNFHAIGFETAAIYVSQSQKITLDTCYIWSSNGFGILLASSGTSQVQDTIIKGCIIYDVVTGIGVISYGGKALNCLITDNIIKNASTKEIDNDGINVLCYNNIGNNGANLNYYSGSTDANGEITITFSARKEVPNITFLGAACAGGRLTGTTQISGGYFTSATYQIMEYTVDSNQHCGLTLYRSKTVNFKINN